MLRTLLLIVCFGSVQYSKGSPWERNNNIREFDLEWQCQQFCNRLKGKLTYNSNDSACTCSVNTNDNLDFNSKHLENKLNDLGLNFKIIDETNNKIQKRDIAAEKNNKILTGNSNIVEATDPKVEIDIPSEPKEEKVLIKERLQRLREKLRNPKGEKPIITAPDNLILGKAAPGSGKEDKEEKQIEDKHEKVDDVKVEEKHSKVIDNKHSDIKDTHIVGKENPAKEEPKKDEHKIDRLDDIRSKLQAWKQAHQLDVTHKNPEKLEEKKEEDNKKEEKKEEASVGIRRIPLIPHIPRPIIPHRPILLPLGAKSTNNEDDKNIPDKIKEIRERIRMRLQSIREKTHPNDDGHIKENH